MGASTRIALLSILGVLAGCSKPAATGYQGYAEGEYIFVASPFAGYLENLAVARGQNVNAGATVFVLEHGLEDAAVDAARARAAAAQSRIMNLRGTKRAPEIEALRAAATRAAASLELAKVQRAQDERLFASGFISERKVAESRALEAQDAAQLHEAEAQIRSALQTLGRSGEIDAALGDYDAARAELAQAQTRLEQKTGHAPAAALVQDTFFRQGEWVPAGSPIASLLPPANIKVRFFVPEAIVGSIREGGAVRIACSGCSNPIAAKITYISPQAEFTPPVIYSRESRAKLVFLIEARPSVADAPRLHPGQPVDVTIETSAAS
jgi:HlyD family secretion protein